MICVPLIFWSVLALLWAIPFSWDLGVMVNWSTLGLAAALAFYATLGPKYFFGMLLMGLVSIAATLAVVATGAPLAMVAIGVFVVSWIGQFYGHAVEGKKPSFFTDLAFLLIGPLWTVEQVLRKIQGSRA